MCVSCNEELKGEQPDLGTETHGAGVAVEARQLHHTTIWWASSAVSLTLISGQANCLFSQPLLLRLLLIVIHPYLASFKYTICLELLQCFNELPPNVLFIAFVPYFSSLPFVKIINLLGTQFSVATFLPQVIVCTRWFAFNDFLFASNHESRFGLSRKKSQGNILVPPEVKVSLRSLFPSLSWRHPHYPKSASERTVSPWFSTGSSTELWQRTGCTAKICPNHHHEKRSKAAIHA